MQSKKVATLTTANYYFYKCTKHGYKKTDLSLIERPDEVLFIESSKRLFNIGLLRVDDCY